MDDGDEKKGIKISFPPNLHGGVYSNNLMVAHSKEEFIMDFLMVAPPEGAVTARIIVSPGHMKRILAALQDNLDKYEHRFGPIPEAEGPNGNTGFVN